ncbi:spore germination protein [Aquibacillus koreensis]|uniref:Spore germination protein n=1 Tax=Aquibacillus koreensis TaxID=279446 RepID=A0A9X3WI22_9BACI|nr:spore germination protein [Aquibacillus koreensis]MCT2535605.1 spore germination protein [Aquibacillus koreensis]MDC3420110.1 spore germination protein [Aquibacillus koreensis]
MPSIVGPIKINSVGGGVVNFGDSFYLSPKSASKTAAGSGAFNTGDFINTNNGMNATNAIDPDAVDQVVGGNA